MPDENPIQVGATQASTSQSGNDNDFTLDFGDEEVKNNGGTDELNLNNEETTESSADSNDNSLDNESSDLEQNNTDGAISEETGSDSYDDFDISFDSGDTNSQTDDKLNNNEEIIEQDGEMPKDDEIEGIGTSIEENSEDLPETDALDYPGNDNENEEEIAEDNNQIEENLKERDETEENKPEDKENLDESTSLVDMDDNKDDSEYSLEMGTIDYSNDDEYSNPENEDRIEDASEDAGDDNINSNDSEYTNTIEESQETMELEGTQSNFIKILSNEVDSLEHQESPDQITNESPNYFMDESDDNNRDETLNINSEGENVEQSQFDLQSKLNEEESSTSDGESNPVETNYQNLLSDNQDSDIQTPEYDLSDDVPEDKNIFDESDDTMQDVSTENEENIALTDSDEQDVGISANESSTEYESEQQQEINLNDSTNLGGTDPVEENVSENNAEEVDNVNEQPNLESDNTMTNESLTLEPMPENQNTTDQIEMKSTLSLDQILDSEVQTNPQPNNPEMSFTNNVNQNKSGNSNKKMIGIVAGVSLFALAGAAAYLAFPMGNSDRQPEDVVYTDISDIDVDTHGTPTETVEEFPEYIDETSIDTRQTETDIESKKGAASIVKEIFPDVVEDTDTQEVSEMMGENEIESETGATPYKRDDSQEEEIEDKQESQSSSNDIKGTVSKYRSDAEGYYKYGQEILNKDIIKYSRQIIYLCDEYEKKIENGEGLDDNSISEFKSQVQRRMSKIEDGMGAAGESATIINNGHIEDESSFEGKDELKDYLYSRSN